MTAAGAERPTDLELVRRAQAGDAAAFGELVTRNHRAVFRAALAGVGSAADADDVAQEAFVAAYQKLGTFRGDAAFRTWVLSIAWRKAMDRRRTVTRWLRVAAAGAPHDDMEDPIERLRSADPSQEDALATGELQQQVRRLVRALPDKLRQTLLLAGCGEYSYAEVAAMLNVPLGTVKWRVSEARRILKQKLQAMGYTHA